MLRILGIIGGVLLLLVVAVLGYAASKPDVFSVKRSTVVKAPPEKIYPLVADFTKWPEWSPYETKDPDMQRTMGSVTSGKGATYAWDGDDNVGAGSMEITNATEPKHVEIALRFKRPFEGDNVVDFTFEPTKEGTLVTWDMHGPQPFFGKLMSTFIDCESMCGDDFNAGLAKMKAAAEK